MQDRINRFSGLFGLEPDGRDTLVEQSKVMTVPCPWKRCVPTAAWLRTCEDHAAEGLDGAYVLAAGRSTGREVVLRQ